MLGQSWDHSNKKIIRTTAIVLKKKIPKVPYRQTPETIPQVSYLL